MELTPVTSTTDLCGLIRFIKKPDRGPDWNGKKWEWEIALLRSIPDWRMVVEKEENWDDIEKARPHKGHGNLCEIFLTAGGLELAKRWLHSDVEVQRKAAENWLFDKVNFLDRFDDELEDKIKELEDKIDTLNEMIPEFEETCQVALLQKQHRPPYSLDGDERELIARLMEITSRNGYLPAALPPILISSETPPLFVAYPELEEENENGGTDQVQRNEQRHPPDTFSIEDLLGAYEPRLQRIIIYERGIEWMVVRKSFDKEWLSAVVLIHEIGHWITHQLPKPGVPTWRTDLYDSSERYVHEGWAQLITWWIANQDDVDRQFKDTFEKLNKMQSPPYRVFEQFKWASPDKVMASLKTLRLLQRPARLEDWEKAL